jgi:Lamin Tail Domain
VPSPPDTFENSPMAKLAYHNVTCAVFAALLGIAASLPACGGSTPRHFGTSNSGGATKTGGNTGSGGDVGSGGNSPIADAGEGGTDGIADAPSVNDANPRDAAIDLRVSSDASGSGGAGGVEFDGGPGSGGSGGRGPGSGGSGLGGGGSGGSATGGAATGGTASGGSATGGSASGGSATGGAATGGAATGGAATGGSGTGGTASGGSGTGGSATGGSASGGSGTGGSGTGGSGAGGSGSDCHLVVNEIQTGSAATATDEFVELFNQCPARMDLTGFTLDYRSAANNSGGADIALLIFPTASMVEPGGFVVIGGLGFPGPVAGRIVSGGLAAVGGAVAIRNPAGIVVDSVSYDILTTANFFTEGTPASNPPVGSSIGRSYSGTDTNNNSSDFKIELLSTPGAANPPWSVPVDP